MATTAASSTSGCSSRTCSTSAVLIATPRTLTWKSLRPTRKSVAVRVAADQVAGAEVAPVGQPLRVPRRTCRCAGRAGRGIRRSGTAWRHTVRRSGTVQRPRRAVSTISACTPGSGVPIGSGPAVPALSGRPRGRSCRWSRCSRRCCTAGPSGTARAARARVRSGMASPVNMTCSHRRARRSGPRVMSRVGEQAEEHRHGLHDVDLVTHQQVEQVVGRWPRASGSTRTTRPPCASVVQTSSRHRSKLSGA